IPGLSMPLFTLRLRLWADGAKLGVRMGHYSFPVRLFHSRHHAGLSRRTTKPFFHPTRTNFNHLPLPKRSGCRTRIASPEPPPTPLQPDREFRYTKRRPEV